MSWQNLQRGTSIENVVEAIRDAILNCTFPPGTQLKQSVIASQLGVSQGPVREALNRLIEEGLVEAIPFRGMFVKLLTRDDIREIYQLRASVESLAAKLALPHLKEGRNLFVMEELAEEVKNSSSGKNPQAKSLTDLNFHRALVEMSGNHRLIKIWSSLMAQSRYILRNLYATNIISPEKLTYNHLDILAALKTNDFELVEKSIWTHMDFASNQIIENWDKVSQNWQVLDKETV